LRSSDFLSPLTDRGCESIDGAALHPDAHTLLERGRRRAAEVIMAKRILPDEPQDLTPNGGTVSIALPDEAKLASVLVLKPLIAKLVAEIVTLRAAVGLDPPPLKHAKPRGRKQVTENYQRAKEILTVLHLQKQRAEGAEAIDARAAGREAAGLQKEKRTSFGCPGGDCARTTEYTMHHAVAEVVSKYDVAAAIAAEPAPRSWAAPTCE